MWKGSITSCEGLLSLEAAIFVDGTSIDDNVKHTTDEDVVIVFVDSSSVDGFDVEVRRRGSESEFFSSVEEATVDKATIDKATVDEDCTDEDSVDGRDLPLRAGDSRSSDEISVDEGPERSPFFFINEEDEVVIVDGLTFTDTTVDGEDADMVIIV